MTSQEEQKKYILMETNQHAATMYHNYHLAGGRKTGVLRIKQQHMIKQHYCITSSLVTKIRILSYYLVSKLFTYCLGTLPQQSH